MDESPKNNYDFILNPPAPKKKGWGFGSSKPLTFTLIAVGVLSLLVIFLIVFSLLSRSSKAQTESLVNLAKQQNELIRVADIGVKKSKNQVIQDFAVTTKLALLSGQSELLGAIQQKRPKFGTKDLASSQNNQTDELLETAEQNNRFDEEFSNWLKTELAKFVLSAQESYQASTDAKIKATLKSQYQTGQSLSQSNQASSN